MTDEHGLPSDPGRTAGPAVQGRPSVIEVGVKLDQEKPRMSLLPFGALELVAQVMTYGARKYAPGNWVRIKNGRERVANAMLRHFTAWQNGERIDKESGLQHLAMMACNALFLLAFDEHTDGVKEEDIAP
jgi:hypothetical protein